MQDIALTSRLHGYGWKVMLVLGIFYLLSGLMYVVAIIMTFVPGFEAYTGMSWSGLTASNPHLTELYVIYLRWAGVIVLAVGAAVCSMSLGPYKRGERWLWYSLFIVGILPLIGTTTFD
jgi:hypothetical protein